MYDRQPRRMTTKINAVTDARGLHIRFVLTPGQAPDVEAAGELLASEFTAAFAEAGLEIDRAPQGPNVHIVHHAGAAQAA